MLRSAFCLLLLNAAPAVRAAGPGTTGATTLTSPTGAMPASLAGAFTAASGTLDTLGYNPAGLADIPRPSLATWQEHRLGLGTLTASFAYAHPTKLGTVALSLMTFDAGSVELIDLDNNARTVSAQKDFIYIAAYATRLDKLGLSIGSSLKYYRSTLAEAASASAALADFGAQYKISDAWNLGLALRNVGQSIKYIEVADPPPTALRLGASYNRALGENQMSLFGDLIQRTHEEDTIGALGMEYGWNRFAFARLGLKRNLKDQDAESEKVGFGVGIALKRFSFDYGMSMADNLEDSMFFTLKWDF